MSGMITNLELQDKVVIGGESIAVFKYRTANVHIQALAEILSKLQMSILEMNSNNSSGGMVYSDSQDINLDWKRYNDEWRLAQKYRHLEPSSMEKVLSVLTITDNEQLRTVNVRCARVVKAISTLIHKLLHCDSAKLEYGFSDRDIKKIDRQNEYVQELILLYVGTGETDNLGMEVATHDHLGTVVPPINLHEATIQEPSPSTSSMPSSDAPDTASTIPKPGSSTGQH